MRFGANSLASIPFAGSDLDGSIAADVVDLIADQESPRAFLFHATPYDPVAAGETDVRASIGLKYPITNEASAYSNQIKQLVNAVPLNIDAVQPSGAFTNWSYNDIGGGTHTISGTDDEFVELDAPTPSSSRAIAGITLDWVSGTSYLVLLTVDSETNLDGGIDGRQTITTVTYSAGDKLVDLPAGASGVYGYRFTSSYTGSGILRYGVGVNNVVSAARTVKITKPSVYAIDNLFDDFPAWVANDIGLEAHPGYNFSSGNSGAVIAASDIDAVTPHNSHSFGFGIGDSFANDSGDWPGQLQDNVGYDGTFHGKGYSGGKLTDDIGTNFQAFLDAYDYDWCVIQGGVNDINGGETVADMKTAVVAMCDYAVSIGVKVKVLTIGPWKDSAGWTSGEQDDTDEYNTWVINTLPVLYDSRVQGVDIYTPLEGDANPDELSNTGNGDTNDYDSGDKLHPNAAGMVVIAEEILDSLNTSVSWPAILKTAVDSQVDLFGEDEDAQGRTSFGNLELMIGDGEHDDITDYYWDGRNVEIKLGNEDMDLADYVSVLKGTAEDITFDQRRLAIVFRGKEQLLDTPIQENEYAGTGGLEGDENLDGNKKPLVFGAVTNITPVLIDQTNLIYQFHDGSADSVVDAFDGGLALTSAGDVADIEAASVDPGFYKTQLDSGFIKLGATPAKLLTLDVNGDNSGDGYITNAADIIKRILINHTDLTLADLDQQSFYTAKLDSSRSSAGIYLSGETVADTVSQLMFSIGGAWTFNRLGLLVIAVFRKRFSTGTITDNDIVIGSFRRDRTQPPSWKRHLGFNRSWTVFSDDQFVGTATHSRRFLSLFEYRYSMYFDASIKTARLGAREIKKDTLLASLTDANTENSRQQVLFSSASDRFTLVARRQQFKYTVGQTVTLDYDRFGISKDMIILSIRENTMIGQTTFRLWG